MHTILRPIVASALIVFGVGAVAVASHNEPRVARSLKTSVVKSYAACIFPDAVTSNGLPACETVVPNDPTCDFGSKGNGVAVASVLSGGVHDVQLKATLRGLDSNCEGQLLTGVVTVRATVDDCTGGDSCTLPDFVDFPVGSCTVTNGTCKLKGTVNGTTPGLLLTGRTTGLEILGCAVKNGTARTFSCGLLVP